MRALADALGVPHSLVQIVTGHRARTKVVEVESASPDAVAALLRQRVKGELCSGSSRDILDIEQTTWPIMRLDVVKGNRRVRRWVPQTSSRASVRTSMRTKRPQKVESGGS